MMTNTYKPLLGGLEKSDGKLRPKGLRNIQQINNKTLTRSAVALLHEKDSTT
jgi:hypothetical protein